MAKIIDVLHPKNSLDDELYPKIIDESVENEGLSGSKIKKNSIPSNRLEGGSVESYIDNWLDEHPEATTTVQDGSVSKVKLTNDLQTTINNLNIISNNIETFGDFKNTREFGKTNRVYTTTGYQTYGGWFSTNPIDLDVNKVPTKIFIQTYTTIYSYAFFDSNDDFISGALGQINSNELIEIDMPSKPSNAKYLRLAYVETPAGRTSRCFFLYNFNELNDEIKRNSNLVLYIKESFDKNILVRRNVYTDSGWQDFSTWYSSYLDITGYSKILRAKLTTYGSNIYSYAFFDENNAFISGFKNNANEGWKVFENIPIPSNAKYLSAIGTSNVGTGLDEYELVLFKDNTVEERYSEFKELKNDYEITKDKVDSFYDNFNSFYFENVLFIGDSLTQGDYGSYPENTLNLHKWSYPYYYGKLTNATIFNKGYSGATCTYYWNNYMGNIDTTKNYDAIYIFLGTNGGILDNLTNDAHGLDYRNYDTSTSDGSYCAIISWCKEKFPNSHIYLLNFPFNSRSEEWTRTNSEVVSKIAIKFNIPLIDIMNKSPFTRNNGNIYRPVGYDPITNPYGNLHFGRLGYLTLAKTVIDLTAKEIEDNKEDYALGY